MDRYLLSKLSMCDDTGLLQKEVKIHSKLSHAHFVQVNRLLYN
jgi:hypothetical protein